MKKWFLLLILTLVSLPGQATPPPANEVFQVSVKTVDPNTFVISWQVKPGFFLYSDRISLDEAKDSNVQIGTLRFPKPQAKIDQQGRTYSVYRGNLKLPVAILGKEPGESLVTLHYQGCADDGFCYPPETRTIKLTINNKLALTEASLEKDVPLPPEPVAEKSGDDIESVFQHSHWTMVILSFFGFGLLLSFTPCVLPMVPVLSGIIVGHSDTMSTRKAFLLSISYVLGMSCTYALVGAVVALLGNNLQIAMQSPPILVLFSLLFVLLSLSMFGFFELRLPVSWQAKLASVSRHQANGHYIGAALMGCLSTLILSPCVTAPLIGALGYIAHSGNVALGVLALFFLGLGMGVPLLLIGTSAGKWLPKAGAWMNAVKSFFGVLLLAVAIYLLDRVLPTPIIMGLWAALLVFSGLFLGALNPAHSSQEKFCRGGGILLFTYGLLILIGASMGAKNPLQPLAGFRYPASMSATVSHQTVTSVQGVQEALREAKGQPVMLDFYADWCTSCKIMEETTFRDPQVENALKHFVVVKVDVTANNKEEKALLRKYNVVAPPTFLFFNQEGKELAGHRLVGEVSAEEFLQKLQKLDNTLN
ncbi:protein-disulfide reductase DsbD [Legionella spiritensis]|uniref:protein-disulfide reductase DsbD n=1 Tax=Legionella spiritensis TaxID=452 RepID=UPI000F6FC209|nr:protein-disulfide reductase DsbD [Legionella spiritensis]VEG92440.1 thiol:disulfide interchange protein DsbD [Legionella spiritensis]